MFKFTLSLILGYVSVDARKHDIRVMTSVTDAQVQRDTREAMKQAVKDVIASRDRGTLEELPPFAYDKQIDDMGRHVYYRGEYGPPGGSNEVGSSGAAYCSRAVDRLKKGPEDLQKWNCGKGGASEWTDTDFTGNEILYWDDYSSQSQISTVTPYLSSGYYFFDKWQNRWSSSDIFDSTGQAHFNQSLQGGAGTCYMMTAMSAVAEWPGIVDEVFITNTKNDAHIHMLKFFIRGKPWVVSVDDTLLFKSSGAATTLVYAKRSKNDQAMWGPIVEKAYAKVRGQMTNSEGGFTPGSVRYLSNIPMIKADTSDITDDTAFHTVLKTADAANYIMTAGTAGSGDDSVFNLCKIAMSHAYSVIGAFDMTDASSVVHNVIMVRNPWGVSYYNQTWSKDDPNWTDALVAQVPHNIDPRTSQAGAGVFIVPAAKFKVCFASYNIGHNRASDGYKDHIYDQDAAVDLRYDYYYFTQDSNQGDLYFTAETYPYKVVPKICTTGALSSGQAASYPVVWIGVYDGSTKLDSNYYFDQFHRPVVISSGHASNVADKQWKIIVLYEFVGSPAKEYTVKVYSKHTEDGSKNKLVDASGNTSVKHYDGSSPSGFTGSTWTGLHNDCSKYDTTTTAAKVKTEDKKIESFYDVFDQCESFEEFFLLLWYNPEVIFIWYKFW